MRRRRLLAGWRGGAVWVLAAGGMLLGGCAVPQRQGGGIEQHLREPTTNAGYWLYLPTDYVDTHREGRVSNRKYPLVMTLHGLKPFDNAHSQSREWQQEADRYGYVVCAPELRSPALGGPLPLNHVSGALKRDEQAILAIMDELERTVDVDPNAVLLTSWSYGGYVAHYMLNRHPDRFSCLAVRQSNFSAKLLESRRVPQYRDYPVAVFYTENDFAICQRESQEAAVWYTEHGFDLTFAEFSGKGHERTPSLAAWFFARTCGAEAKSPPSELASMRVKEPPVLDRTARRPHSTQPVEASAGGREKTKLPALPPPPPRTTQLSVARNTPHSRAPSSATMSGRSTGEPLREKRTSLPAPSSTGSVGGVQVRLSSAIGVAPLFVSYSAVLPTRLRRQAYYLWTDNGEPISNGVNGQVYLTKPGEHRISVLVTTEDGVEYTAGRTVKVLRHIGRQGGSRASTE